VNIQKNGKCLKYNSEKNPYRKIFINDQDFVACDFSVLLPAWRLKTSDNYDESLFSQSIEYAESKKYYSFYSAISSKKWEEYFNFIKPIIPNYLISIEETVPNNEKPVSILFWEWVVESKSIDHRLHIVYHFLPQEFRNE